MRKLIAIALLFLASCSETKTPDANTISSLKLKRGSVISCGARDQGFGKVGFETSCRSELKWDFDMGVALLHSFEYDEAEKVFAKIIDAQPDCAMAYWGVAMANYHTLWAPPNADEFEKGSKAIAIARSIGAQTEREKSYINAIGLFYDHHEKDDHAIRYARFESAMKTLFETYEQDPEAAVFYALVLTGGANPADKTYSKQKQAVAILENLYKDRPNHPGIIHYIIHSYDNPQLASLALDEARKYASIAPSSAHAQHMPSHIFTRLGLWDEDIRSNRDAANSAKCYAESAGIKGHWDEELHSLDYLIYAYLQKNDTISAAREVSYMLSMKEITPFNFKVAYALAASPARLMLEKHDWKGAAQLKLYPGNIDWSKYLWPKAIHIYARAMGQANSGELAGAQSSIHEMEIIRDTLLAQKDVYKANQVSIQINTANAWLLFRSGKQTEGLDWMIRAADMEDATQKHAVTPGEVLPARELLGDMLLEMGRSADAIAAYEADLAERPNRYHASQVLKDLRRQ
ncbi:MAG: hypothetical protein ABW174_11815 [Flavitalea sp.]